jgi:uncharacterized integral membrane protein
MRQVNFVVIFVFCLALVLFGIENTEPAVIHLVEGVELVAPLSIELLLAMGVGAVLAWVFSVWAQIQRSLELGKDLRQRETKIQQLEQDVQRYKVELEEQQRLLPASSSNVQELETAEVYAK